MRVRTIAAYLAAVLVSFNSSMVAAPVRVSPEEMAERIVYRTVPTYPREARQERVQGTVELDVVIDDDGVVAELTVITGHPLLAEAAVEAVSQWLYDPYRVDGRSAEVTTTVNVSFSLN